MSRDLLFALLVLAVLAALADGEEAGAQPGLAGTTRILEERADRIALEAELDHPGTLVLLDGYDPAAPPERP